MNDLQIDDIKTDENAAMVLLVDDQAMIGEAVRRGLSNEENIDFHFCSDPHQAIAHAVRIKPTVILQDLVMPGLRTCQPATVAKNLPWCCPTPPRAARGLSPRSCARPWQP